MNINEVKLKDFMIFNDLNVKFADGINIISGENSTGKTALLKVLYSTTKGYANALNSKDSVTKNQIELSIVNKFQGVFKPDKNSIGRLVNKNNGNNSANIFLSFDDNANIELKFTSSQTKHLKCEANNIGELYSSSIVYIPPKEIISTTSNFVSLYDDYDIDIEEVYYDLARLLERPTKKNNDMTSGYDMKARLEKILNGQIIQKNKTFYLSVKGEGEYEMGLLSEGYRKLATIVHLIASGSLSENAILFWDEPETNMNPKLIKPVVDMIIELSRMGVQVFVTTHDYFIQQCFSMAMNYENDNKKLNFKFISLYKDESNKVRCEAKESLEELEHNSVMEEFNALYDREQGYIYGY